LFRSVRQQRLIFKNTTLASLSCNFIGCQRATSCARNSHLGCR
jgi:hypothetical protein